VPDWLFAWNPHELPPRKSRCFRAVAHEHYRGKGQLGVIERDDGYVDAPDMAAIYSADVAAWPVHERRGLRWVRGRVLDIGCGAGRVALHFQRRGSDVLGIDNSPLAVKVCRLRGLRKVRVLSISDLSDKLGLFDTIVMYGNNFGLFSNPSRARRLLRRFRSFTTEDARIIATTFDPHQTKKPEHRSYQRRNLARGRMAGQIRLRIRYKQLATPYYDYLFVSKAELNRILQGTGWHVARWIDSQGPAYSAIIGRNR
jgi:SAM-dependent methyltransferase